jgi:hypothetical protein
MMAWCETCYGTGVLDCLCGGDLCVCGVNTFPCGDCCDDFRQDEQDDFEDFAPIPAPQKEKQT